MKKGIIFDLDQTLVNSSIAESYRKNRDWQKVYSSIPLFKLYDGFHDAFSFIKDRKIKVCIVSNSPRPYIQKVINHFSIPCDDIVGYHDVKKRKPDPEAMNKALANLNLDKKDVISFGDQVNDIIASNLAGIESVACLWGVTEPISFSNNKPTYVLKSPREIVQLLD